MKLSQALIIRSDYQNKIYELKKRIINNSKVQEGENVSEDPMKLLKELNRVIDELDIITKRINKTNNESLFEDNITIADAKLIHLIIKCNSSNNRRSNDKSR